MLVILEEIEEVCIWPSRTPEHIKCSVIDMKDPKQIKFVIDIRKEKVVLLNAIWNLYPSSLGYAGVEKMWEQIEAYGDVRYEECDSKHAEMDAGEDI